MARHLFGASASDWLVHINTTDSSLRAASGLLTAWDSRIGGQQHTDLTTPSGTPLTDGLVGVAGGQYSFYGPDGVRWVWVDGGGSERELVIAPTLYEEIVGGAFGTGSTIGIDTDGIPYFDPAGVPDSTATVLPDVDGVPYVSIGA